MTLKEYMMENHPDTFNEDICPKAYSDTSEFCIGRCGSFARCEDCLNQEYIPKEGEEMRTKKYIIEIPEETSYINVVRAECGDVVGCKTITLGPLKPYETDSLYRDGRRDGQTEVQELICELLEMDYFELGDCFGSKSLNSILSTLSYGEAKEKYDTYMENKIKVGDEISDGEETGYVLWIEDKECMAKLGSYDCPQSINLNKRNFRKTGRHNPKLAEVMRDISET